MNATADWLARRLRASPRLRALAVRAPWGRAVTVAIFSAMPRRLRPASAAGLDLVVRWDVEGERRRHLIVREGAALVRRDADRDPDVILALDRLALLELATGAANGPQLFMTGRVKLTGDLMLAQRVAGVFAVPGAG